MRSILIILSTFSLLLFSVSCDDTNKSSVNPNDLNNGDSYEPDDVVSMATTISHLDEAQKHTLSENDRDWFIFTAEENFNYIIYTIGSTDTYIDLFDSTGDYLLDFNNDWNLHNAQITLSPTYTTTYTFRVKGSSSDDIGEYKIALEKY